MSPQTRRRDYLILAVLAVVSVVAYNLAAHHNRLESFPAAETATTDSQFETSVSQGNNFMDRGLYDHAIRQYRQALELDSLHLEVMIDLGACYHAIGRFREAVFHLEHALALAPDHRVALFNLGVVHLARADTSACRTYWQRFLEVVGDEPEAEVIRRKLEEL
ncbi:MAG: tetratricopeptide repeat protein [candidate division Zixibacteria bacterium]|nr:tetratricopeptide repeat protein [candidate division Zixibacteria bacterium]